MKNLNIYCLILFALSLFAACDHIDDDEKLIYVKPAEVARNVLIEDFTGQNCPIATQTIAELQEAYGNARVVAVAIHSGPFARSARGVPYAMTTETGEEYYSYWRLDRQPIGIVNRRGPSDYTDWGTQVHEEMSKPTRVDISIWVDFDKDSRRADISVSALGVEGTLDGKLQVWLTEDGITAPQSMPDGTTNQQYIHNHVFRNAVNGTWGSDFHIEEGESRSDNFSYIIPEDKDWVPENMLSLSIQTKGWSRWKPCHWSMN